MPMKNNLNISELLKRLGVVGDSLASAPLLDEMRLVINLADLTDLVPPIGVPIGGASIANSSGGGEFNKWVLHCKSVGGLRINWTGNQDSADAYRFWVSEVDDFVGSVVVPHANFSFAGPAVSEFANAPPAPAVAPLASMIARGPSMGPVWREGNWIGPGQFFHIESQQSVQTDEVLSVMWREYPAGLNP